MNLFCIECSNVPNNSEIGIKNETDLKLNLCSQFIDCGFWHFDTLKLLIKKK